MKKIYLILASIFLFNGCGGVTYYVGKESFSNKELAIKRYKSNNAKELEKIEPLDTVLTEKTLLVFIPSEKYFFDAFFENKDIYRGQFKTNRENMIDYLAVTNLDAYEFMYKAVKNRNIYKETKLVHREIGGHLEARVDEDILYLFHNDKLSIVQWYIISKKSGRQAIHFDKGKETTLEKTKSFLNSIEAFIIQE